MSEAIFDHEQLEVYRLSIDYVAASYGMAKALTGANRHVRDQWLRAAQLRRIVSMLTRLIQRTDRDAQISIEYEYEYRDAEYE